MSAFKFLTIGIGLVLGFGACAGGCGAIRVNNDLISQEKAIQANWRTAQVEYDTFWKTVKEQGQVADQYSEKFKDIFLGSIDGRYSADAPAMFIMESNPTLSPDLFVQVQRSIEAGRAKFAQQQTNIADRIRRFDTDMSTAPNTFFVGMLGFPHELTGEYAPSKDLDGDGLITVLDYPTITSAKTQEVFKSGREDEPLNVFSK